MRDGESEVEVERGMERVRERGSEGW